MKIFKTLLICLFISCNSFKEKKVTFSKEVNQYNFLDKDHELMYIYDFESFLTDEQKELLIDRVKRLETLKEITIFIIIDKKVASENNILKDVQSLNKIMAKKFNIKNLIVLKLSKRSRAVGISVSPPLTSIFSDSICNKIIDQKMIPSLKVNNYYDAVDEGLKGLKEIVMDSVSNN